MTWSQGLKGQSKFLNLNENNDDIKWSNVTYICFLTSVKTDPIRYTGLEVCNCVILCFNCRGLWWGGQWKSLKRNDIEVIAVSSQRNHQENKKEITGQPTLTRVASLRGGGFCLRTGEPVKRVTWLFQKICPWAWRKVLDTTEVLDIYSVYCI